MDKRNILKSLLAIILITLATLSLGNGYAANLITWMAIAALVASSLRFVTLIGELNFATAAFVGLGAYATGLTVTVFDWPFFVALVMSGLVAAAFGFMFGYVTLKTKGPYFLLIGFAFTEVVRLIYTKLNILGGNSGMVGIFPPEYFGPYFSALAIVIVGIMLVILYVIEQSHLGKCFIGIRDNDQVALSVGINVHLTKVFCLTIGAFAAGLAGGLTAFVNNVISPGDFSFLLSTFALAYLKVGGEDHPVGPIAGAVLLVLLSSLSLSFGGEDHIFYGLAIVLTVLLMPKGVIGLLEKMCRSMRAKNKERIV
jgi:branched-chain amino acid transport system permease protein